MELIWRDYTIYQISIYSDLHLHTAADWSDMGILCIYPVQYSDSAQYEAAKKGSAAYHLFLYDTADHFYHSWSVQLP